MSGVIQFNEVFKVYGSEVALAGASFEVPPGTVFALLGENGAGKTTAIRIMLGLADADRGNSTVLGMESRLHGEYIRRRVGYVPERPTLYEWMTVKEIGWFPISPVTPLPDHAFQFPGEQTVFHWHGETFDCPDEAVHLARSVACENQAFQIGRHVVGLQFHLETTVESAAALVNNCRDELVPAPYVQDEKTILAASPGNYHAINVLMTQLLEHITSA